MRSQAHRVLAEVFRDARRNGWWVENVGARRQFRSYAWNDGRLRVSVQIGPAGARLTVRQLFGLDWALVAQCQIGAWQQALSILETYGVVAFRHLPAYQRGLRDGRRDLAPMDAGSSPSGGEPGEGS